MISLRNVTFAYDSAPVLVDVTLDIAGNDFLVLRGESGCGKSTLLRLLCRLEAPQSGLITLDGVSYADVDARVLRRRVAYLQQLPVMLEGTVRDILLLSRRFDASAHSGVSDAELRGMLSRARLDDLDLGRNPRALSVGQQQRLALIRLLIMKPACLLLDEPAAALDAESAGIIHEWIGELHRDQGTAVVLVTHAPLPDAPAGARRLLMRRGTITEDTA